MPPTPRILGKYELIEKIAYGGMGVLYRARNPNLDQDVALKVLRTDFAAPDARERFSREAQLVFRLKHPNIVRVFDFGEDDGQLFIVMEYIRGETLRSAIDRRMDWSVSRRLQIFCQACDAVSYAHRVGLIHRDLKPSNIMLDDEDGLVKVLDFGLARHAEAFVTRIPAIAGSPNYMSPEQVLGDDIDQRSDTFALTAILFELLTYTLAFPGQTEEAAMQAVVDSTPLAPSSINRALPTGIDDTIRRGLEKAPSDRFQSVDDLRNEVVAVLGDSGLSGWFQQQAAQPLTDAAQEYTVPGPARKSWSPATERPATSPANLSPSQFTEKPKRAATRAWVMISVGVALVAALTTSWAVLGGRKANTLVPPTLPIVNTVESTTAEVPFGVPSPTPRKAGSESDSSVASDPARSASDTTPLKRSAVADHDAVTTTLTQLAAAYGRLDAPAAAALMLDRPTDEMRQAFARYAEFSLAIEPTEIIVDGDVARAMCRERRTFKTLSGSAQNLAEENVVYELERTRDGWRIASRRVQ